MSDILIIKNISREGPGILQNILEQYGVSYDIVNLDRGDTLPVFAHKALVVLGGPDSANDQTVKMTEELAYVRRVIKSGAPYMGICLGLQVAVKAMGGAVVKSPVKEVGLLDDRNQQFTVELTNTGQGDPLLHGLPRELPVFQLHGETVELTVNMSLLGQGEYCRNQIVKLADKAYGIQSHFEITTEMLAIWTSKDPDLLPLGETTILQQFEKIQAEYTQTGQIIFRNFLMIADLL